MRDHRKDYMRKQGDFISLTVLIWEAQKSGFRILEIANYRCYRSRLNDCNASCVDAEEYYMARGCESN